MQKGLLQERRSPQTIKLAHAQDNSSMTESKETFIKQRDNDRDIVFWRGMISWTLSTIFVFMLALLILFLFLLSRSPLDQEDLISCRESEYDENSDVIQLTQLNFDRLTTQKDTSWLIELYVTQLYWIHILYL